MDVHTKEQRSYNMSRVRSKNTKPELIAFSVLKSRGIPFRKHFSIVGKPDVVLPASNVAVFIDGEFWHGKDFTTKKSTLPQFWVNKIAANIKRDRRVNRILRNQGWHVIHIWDKKLLKNPESSIDRIVRFAAKVKGSNSRSSKFPR